MALKDFMGSVSEGGELADIGRSVQDKNMLAEEMLELHGSPDAIKRAAHLISFTYLALQEAVKIGQKTNDEIKREMEEVASRIKIRVLPGNS